MESTDVAQVDIGEHAEGAVSLAGQNLGQGAVLLA